MGGAPAAQGIVRRCAHQTAPKSRGRPATGAADLTVVHHSAELRRHSSAEVTDTNRPDSPARDASGTRTPHAAGPPGEPHQATCTRFKIIFWTPDFKIINAHTVGIRGPRPAGNRAPAPDKAVTG